MKQLYLLLFAAFFFIAPSYAVAGESNKLSDIFIENQGQVKNEKGASADNVLFYKGGPMELFITTSGFSAVVKRHDKKSTTYNKIDFKFENATIGKDQVIFVRGQNAPINIYGPGKNNITGINSSKTVLIKNIYPGIDWLWSIDNKGGVKHDFMVNIGADASVINYTVDGANIDNSGGDILKYIHPNFRVKEGPVVFRTKEKDLPGQILVKGNNISFQLTDSLKKGGFTIDPPLELDWSYGFDTVALTAFSGIAVDTGFNTYTVGYSGDYNLPTFPQVTGSYVSSGPAGGLDAVIMKSNSRQELVWATFLGGSGNDGANAIAVAPSGIFVTGYSESWDFPQALLGTYNQPVALFGRDAFIAKFNYSGLLKWSTGYGGSNTDEAMDIQYYNGNIFVGGYTYSPNFPTQAVGGAYFYQNDTLTQSDAFLLEFDTTADLIWGTCFGGSGNDYFSSLSVDASGIYAVGFSDSTRGTPIPLMPNGSAYYQTTYQNTESFITNFTSAGALNWCTYYGGAGNDVASCIVHNSCELLICGKTDGTGLPVRDQGNGNYYQPAFAGGGSDGFIAGFDPNTYAQLYGTYYGAAGYDALTKFTADSNCNTIFTGFTQGGLQITGDTNVYFFQTSTKGGFDGLMLGLNSSQNVFWSTYFGSSIDDYGLDVAIISLPIIDMVGNGFYNYSMDTIGGTFLSIGTHVPRPDVTTNGVSNRFNQLAGENNPLGGGPDTGCHALLQYQSLIPVRNTCPNQCNGLAIIDTNNVGGCPPVLSLWSDGGTTLVDSDLCPQYWNEIYDANGSTKTLYGKFDVLSVPAVSPIITHCGIVPDWYSYIKPIGGGPPYTITFRGVSQDSCPNTAYFDINDTAGCTVSFSVLWYESNVEVTNVLGIDTNSCNLLVNTTFGNDCPDFSGDTGWRYHIIEPNGDTLVIRFSNLGANVIISDTLDSMPGGVYHGYLDMGDCQSPTNNFIWFPPPHATYVYTRGCDSSGGTVAITIYANSSLLNYYGGGYPVYIGLYDPLGPTNGNNYVPIFYDTIFLTGDTTIVFQHIGGGAGFGADSLSYYYILGVIQDSTVEGHCGMGSIIFWASQMAVFINNPTVYCGVSDTLVAHVIDGVPPYTFTWYPAATNDSIDTITTPGNYTVRVTDSTGCSNNATDSVLGSAAVTDSIAANQHPCDSTLFEKATAYPSGGTPAYNYLWSSGETTPTAMYLTSGTDWVKVTDYKGCTDSVSFAYTKQAPLQVTDSVGNPPCGNLNNGSITLNVTGGYLQYQINWSSDSLSGYSLTGLKGGSYTYTLTDSLQCTATATVLVAQPDSISYQIVNVTSAGCSFNNGSVQINVAGGTGTLNIAWSDSGSGFIRDSMYAGSYTFTISDNNGCNISGKVTIDSVQTLDGYVYETDVTCYGTPTGSGDVYIYTGIQPIIYDWSIGLDSTSPTLQNLDTGQYSVTVTDAVGCSFSSTFYVSQPDSLVAYTDSTFPASCYGYDGYADVDVNGGSYPYYVLWSNNEQGQTLYDLAAGYYTYTVYDNNNCSDTGSVTIEMFNGIQPTLTVTNACSGDSSGTASVQVYDPDSYDVYYYWSNNVYDTNAILNLPPNSYYVEIEDDNECDTTLYFTISPSSTNLTVSADTGSGISCYGSYAVVTISASNGYLPYSGTGTYYDYGGTQYYTVTDQSGCGITDTVNLFVPTQINNTVNVTNAGCTNPDGSIEVITTGGVSPYQVYINQQYYNYSDSITEPVPPGNYPLYVYDDNECFSYASAIVGTSSSISAFVNSYNDLCYGDSSGYATANVTSGAQPVSYKWSNGDSTDNNIHNLTSGTYSITITDANGCTFDTSFFIGQPPTPVTIIIDTGSGILCNGNSCWVDISASGGNGGFTDTGSYYFYAGQNYITVYDQSGCAATDSFTLSQPAPLVATDSVIPPGCGFASGIIILSTTGGTGPYTVFFNDNDYTYYDTVSLTNVQPGFYELNVEDSNYCTYYLNIPVQTDSVLVANTRAYNPTCSGNTDGSVSITVTTGVGPYYVNGNSFTDSITIHNLGQGAYTYTVTNAGGCSTTAQAALFAPLPLTGSDSIIHDVLCYGNQGTVLVTASGGTPPYTGTGQYTLSGGSTQQIITDSNNCQTTVNINLSNPDPISAGFNIIQPVVCSGGLATVNIYASGGTAPILGTGGFQYYSGNQQQILTDANNCPYTLNFFIPDPPVLQVTANVGQQPGCSSDSGSVTINASGGVSPYQLIYGSVTNGFTGSIQQSLQAGAYTEQVQDSLGCVQNVSFNLTPTNNLSGILSDFNPSCYGSQNGVISISMQNGSLPYYISGQKYDTTVIAFDSLPAADYSYTITDSTGCSITLSTSLSQPNALVMDTHLLQSGITCVGLNDAVVSINAIGGTPQYNYTLENLQGVLVTQSGNSFTSLAAGTYTVLVTDSHGCADSLPLNIPAFVPSTDSIVVDSASCYGTGTGVIKIYPQPADRNPYTFSLNGASPQVFNVFYNLAAGAYQIVVSDTNNCMDTLNVSIGQPDSIDGRVWLNDTLLPLDSIILTSRGYASFTKLNNNPWTVTFSPATAYTINTDTLVQVQTQQSISYTVTVYMDSTNKDCFIQYHGYIDVLDIADFPNTITPNGDGFNDVWKIDLIKYPNSEVTIFDRWGEVVYASTDYTNDWGGVDQKNGKPLPDGAYFYILKVPSLNNVIYKGNINIVDSKN